MDKGNDDPNEDLDKAIADAVAMAVKMMGTGPEAFANALSFALKSYASGGVIPSPDREVTLLGMAQHEQFISIAQAQRLGLK